MATRRTTATRKTSNSHTGTTRDGAGLGAAISMAPTPATEPRATRRTRLLDAALRDLDARQQGYLLVRKHLDWALAECEAEAVGQRHDERTLAGMLAAVLCMRTLLAGEMERVTEQTRILLTMRGESAA